MAAPSARGANSPVSSMMLAHCLLFSRSSSAQAIDILEDVYVIVLKGLLLLQFNEMRATNACCLPAYAFISTAGSD
jgi:hypothetical protein